MPSPFALPRARNRNEIINAFRKIDRFFFLFAKRLIPISICFRDDLIPRPRIEESGCFFVENATIISSYFHATCRFYSELASNKYRWMDRGSTIAKR